MGASNLHAAALRRETKDCKARVKCYAHTGLDGGLGHRWAVPFDACQEAHCTCPACQNKTSKKRAGRVSDLYRRIAHASGLHVGVLAVVLTLPPEVQTDDVEVLKSLRKAARGVLRSWVAQINGLTLSTRSKPGWCLTGVDTWHPAGDADPAEFKPHIHAQIPAVAWWRPAGDLDDRPSWRTLRYKVMIEELADLREMWGAALVDAGWHPRSSMHDKILLDRCVVHYRWFSGGSSPKARRQLAHRVRYDFRHWPEWKATWRKITWWGYAAPAAQPKAGIEALDEADKPEKHDGEPTLCPECGATAEWSGDIGRDADKLSRQKSRKKILDLVGAPAWVSEAKYIRWYDPPPEYLPRFDDRKFA